MSLENMSLEERDQLALLAKSLADNPATRKELLKLTKQVNPELSIPEIEIEEKIDQRLSQIEQRAIEAENKLREKEAIDDLNKRRRALIEKGIANGDQDIQEIEKVMLEKGITNHEAAAEYWEWMKQASATQTTSYSPSPLKGFDMGKYMKNPNTSARDEAFKALNELRNQRRPIGI